MGTVHNEPGTRNRHTKNIHLTIFASKFLKWSHSNYGWHCDILYSIGSNRSEDQNSWVKKTKNTKKKTKPGAYTYSQRSSEGLMALYGKLPLSSSFLSRSPSPFVRSRCFSKKSLLLHCQHIQEMQWVNWHWFLESGKPRRPTRLKAHHDGFKPANSQEWQSLPNEERLIQLRHHLVWGNERIQLAAKVGGALSTEKLRSLAYMWEPHEPPKNSQVGKRRKHGVLDFLY